MSRLGPLFLPVASVCFIILSSNILVSFPVYLFGLADYLTWGAFTYPLSFLVTDVTNRLFGARVARYVVIVGFAFASVFSFFLAEPRLVMSSAVAFLCSQLLDVTLFDLLRYRRWWVAPFISSLFGGLLDTVLFFSLAFSLSFSFIWTVSPFAVENTIFLGEWGPVFPRWAGWAAGDFAVKMLMGFILLLPYRRISSFFSSSSM